MNIGGSDPPAFKHIRVQQYAGNCIFLSKKMLVKSTFFIKKGEFFNEKCQLKQKTS